jgi:hypothetical protein
MHGVSYICHLPSMTGRRLKSTVNMLSIAEDEIRTVTVCGCLGGLVVSVLATGPRGCGFEPGQGDKNPQHTFLRMGSKDGGPTGTDRINSHFLRPFCYSLQRSQRTGPPDSTGGRQSALVDKLGVSPSRTRVHIVITGG